MEAFVFLGDLTFTVQRRTLGENMGLNSKWLYLAAMCSLLFANARGQSDSTIPLRIQLNAGGTLLRFHGIEQDAQFFKDNFHLAVLKGLNIPLQGFGKDINYALSVSTPISDVLSIGLRAQYFRTNSNYGFAASSDSVALESELDYSLSRFCLQGTLEGKRIAIPKLGGFVYVRLGVGLAYVEYVKDLRNAFGFFVGDPMYLTLVDALFITGRYKALVPEASVDVNLDWKVFKNLNMGISLSGVGSYSGNVAGTFSPSSARALNTLQNPFHLFFNGTKLDYYGMMYGIYCQLEY